MVQQDQKRVNGDFAKVPVSILPVLGNRTKTAASRRFYYNGITGTEFCRIASGELFKLAIGTAYAVLARLSGLATIKAKRANAPVTGQNCAMHWLQERDDTARAVAGGMAAHAA